MALPQAPDNMEDFTTQAKNFVDKAKAGGEDNIGIANVLNFMYQATQQNIVNKQQQEQIEGTLGLQKAQAAAIGPYQYDSTNNKIFNPVTGVATDAGGGPNPAVDLGVSSPNTSSAPSPTQTTSVSPSNTSTATGPKYSANTAAFFNQWQPKKATTYQQTTQTPQLPTSPFASYGPTSAPAMTSTGASSPLWMNQSLNPMANFLPKLSQAVGGYGAS